TAFAGKWGFPLEVEDYQSQFDKWGGFAGSSQGSYRTGKDKALASYAAEYPHVSRALGAFGCDFVKESVAAGKPFCLSLSFKAPHKPHNDIDPEDQKKYQGVVFDRPASFGQKGLDRLPIQSKLGRQYLQRDEWDADHYQDHLTQYYQLVSGVDTAIGMVVAELERLGVADNTVVIYTADNGYSCGAHGLQGKVLPYEAASRIPLILVDPRSPTAGKKLRSNAVVGNIDFAPTILSLAGLDVPAKMDGKSLMPLMADPSRRVRESMPIIQNWGVANNDHNKGLAVATEEWKYINWCYADANVPPAEELFNLKSDQDELANQAGNPECRAVLEHMRKAYDGHLQAWVRECVQTEDYTRYGSIFSRQVPWQEKQYRGFDSTGKGGKSSSGIKAVYEELTAGAVSNVRKKVSKGWKTEKQVDTGITLGDWHVLGPFKLEEFGNVARELEYRFGPEVDYLGEQPVVAELPTVGNLALGAKASSPDKMEVQKKGNGPSSAVDGTLDTLWDDKDNGSFYALRLEFEKPTTFNTLKITGWKHQQFSPKNFAVVCDGKEIAKVENAQYAKNVLELNVPETTASSLELQITGVYGKSPAIRELEIYNRACMASSAPLELDPLDLAKGYQMKKFPGYLELDRKWEKRADWTDGFHNLLPRGPAPSRNESVYLYRTITADEAQTVTAHLRAKDFYKVWLNGRQVAVENKLTKFNIYPTPKAFQLALRKGENQLLVKNTVRWAERGFSFGIEGMHGIADSHYIDINTHENKSEADAKKYVEGFKFKPEPIPMYAPSVYKLDEYLSKFSASLAAAAYDAKLATLEKRKLPTMAFATELEGALDAEVKQLPPILFIRHPLVRVNAIAPYINEGAVPSAICRLDPSNPGAAPKVVFEQEGMRIYDMSLSFDAKTIFFSARQAKGEPWHIYSVGVAGRNLKQITTGDASNISPCELPNGRLAFISTRHGTFVVCQGKRTGMLFTMAKDGSDARLISANIDSDHTPRVTNEGRILFTRWDYGVEKNVFARHGLWTVNPDGTRLQLFFGNTIEDPGGFWSPMPIPNRPEVVCVFGPHHQYHAGMIGLVWNGRGTENPRGEGYRWVSREMPVYGDHAYPDGYQDPYAVNEKQFLCSYGGTTARNKGGKSRDKNDMAGFAPLKLMYLDVYGNERIIHKDPNNLSCYQPILLRPRAKPPVIPDSIPPNPWTYQDTETMNRENDGIEKISTLLVQDVYRGISKHVKRGEAKYVAVMEQVQKSRMLTGGEAWGHSPLIGRGTVHARRLVGLVPVEEDGSVHFTVPALRSISLNVLNAEGKTLMRMGSDMHTMPGERLSCIGCHEVREGIGVGGGQAPMMRSLPTAAKKPPVTPTVPEAGWGTDGLIDYIQVIQPIWDKHCVSCHKGAKPDGNVNMTADKTRFFCQSYGQLVDRDIVDHLSVFSLGHDETTPLTVGAMVSRIDEFLTEEHCESELTWEERFRIYCWIDANVPYYGTYDSELVEGKFRGLGMRDSWETKDKKVTWATKDLQSVFDRRCLECHRRPVLNQSWLIPVEMEVASDIWGDKALTSHGFGKKWKLVNKLGPEFRINLTHPAHSSLLMAPLSKKGGGLGMCKEKDGSPVFANQNDKDYQTMLKAIEVGAERLAKYPRIDMLGLERLMNPRKACFPLAADPDAAAAGCGACIEEEEPQAKAKKKEAEVKPAQRHFMFTSHKPDSVTIIDETGNIKWQSTDIKHPQAAQVLPDGSVFSSQIPGAKMIGKDGKTKWEYSVPDGCQNPVAQVLGNGRFLVGNEGPCQLHEIDASGKVHKTIQLESSFTKSHGQFRLCRKTVQGNYLVPFTKEGAVREYDGDANVVRDFGAFDTPVSAIRLPDGGTLIGSAIGLQEFDASGKEVWRYSPEDAKPDFKMAIICSVVRLKNGNTLFTQYSKAQDDADIVEVTRDKKVVMKLVLPDYSNMAALQLLDADMKPSQDVAVCLPVPTGIPGGFTVFSNGWKKSSKHWKNPGTVIQCLETSEAERSNARKAIKVAGCYGRVSAISFDGKNLPYVDGSVNRLVVADGLKIEDSEIQRVLSPGGVAIVDGKEALKPVPSALDEWTHFMYDASGIGAGNDRAVGPPRHIQWAAGPRYGRSHENMSSVSASVTAGGRIFTVMDEGPKASIYLPSDWNLTARDAFSGVLLWKIPIKEWHARLFPLKSGPTQLPHRLVAVGDRVYVTLGLYAPVSEIDAATGQILRTFEGTEFAEELSVVDGKLIVVTHDDKAANPFRGRPPKAHPDLPREEQTISQAGSRSLSVIDLESGNTLWNRSQGNMVPLTAVAMDGNIFLMVGNALHCVELATGKMLWEQPVAKKAVKSSTAVSPTVLAHEGTVFAAVGGTLSAFDAAKGEKLWDVPCAKEGFKMPASIFIVNGLIWDVDVQGEPYKPKNKSLLPEMETTDIPPGPGVEVKRRFVGYDLRTGEVRKDIPMYGDQSFGVMHHRCHIPRATGDYLLTGYPGIEFIDTNTGRVQSHSWIRGACLYGFIPANGLIYTPPHPCACYAQAKMRGFNAVAPKRPQGAGSRERGTRLVKG
ncbi:MAG: PQQ-binding-like beta-propeller repeat protein, partial [Kiritimatiellales bacterium]|nr:PQQ-binding-like beta-propeller repeat protein [Kiritimatiellales bacterium]